MAWIGIGDAGRARQKSGGHGEEGRGDAAQISSRGPPKDPITMRTRSDFGPRRI